MDMQAIYIVIIGFGDCDMIPKVIPCASYDKALEVMERETRDIVDRHFADCHAVSEKSEDFDEVTITTDYGDCVHITVKHQMIEF